MSTRQMQYPGRFPYLWPCGIAALLCAATPCFAWMNPSRDRIAEANHLFQQGKFDAAITKYGEALVDDPDSPLLNFNMGDANYKAGKFAEATASFSRVRVGDDDPKREARIAYNIGNAQYRLGAAAEADKPQDALQAYAAALVAYRRALGTDASDRDAKFNYEFVSKKIEDLKKKLEQQKQQQEKQQQQQQDQQQQSQQQQEQQQQNQQQEQQQAQQEQQQQPQPDQRQPDQQQQQAQQDKSDQQKSGQQDQQQAEQDSAAEQQKAQQERAAQAAAAGGEKKDTMSPAEAAALVDTAKNDELQPDEFARQAQGAAVAEPAQDW